MDLKAETTVIIADQSRSVMKDLSTLVDQEKAQNSIIQRESLISQALTEDEI